MRAPYQTIFLLMFILATCLDAQERLQPVFDQLRGIVNRYLEVTEVVPCRRSVRVADSATILSSGDRVVMIQMQGARIVEANDSTYGTILDLNGAGSVEYLVVERIGGDSIIFTTPWVHSYDVRGRVQLVRVSRHADAQIAATVLPQPWNGRTGGVVAIDVDQTLALDADVSATAMGFRGGRVSTKKDICNGRVWSAPYASGDGGQKGEGIATTISGLDVCARGAAANGGGGGNGANAGGAGGGGGGNGGNGGDASSLCDPYIGAGGKPGAGMSSRIVEQRLMLGGGGGGGHQNNDQGTPGANGGGIVMIRAQLIAVSAGRILSQGETVRDTSAWRNGVPLQPGDGTGGGGGGGSVMVDAGTIIGKLVVNVRGGGGGHVGARYQPNGPGGGGGGGVVLLPRPHPNVTVLAAGGSPGVHVSFETGPAVFRRPWGATAGDSGVTVSPFTWRVPTSPTLTVGGADTICSGSSVVLTASDGFASYRWSTGQTGRTITVATQGAYTVTATDSAGCTRTPVTVNVGVKTVQLNVDTLVDFGTTEVGLNRRSAVVVRNTGLEVMTISGVVTPPDVRVDGATFPLMISAGDSVRIELEFIASRVMTLRDSLRIDITAPCSASTVAALVAEVTSDRVEFLLPDVDADRPSSSVSIPIRVRLDSPTPDLQGIGLQLTVGIDARLFAPSDVVGAMVVSDTVDKARALRMIELEVASADVSSMPSVLATLNGTALLATIDEAPITIEKVTWNRPFGGPVWRADTGRLRVGMACASARRAVRFISEGLLVLRPNPADDQVTVDVGVISTAPWCWSIIDPLGGIIAQGVFIGGTAGTTTLPLAGIPAGGYVVRLAADNQVVYRPLIIQR